MQNNGKKNAFIRAFIDYLLVMTNNQSDLTDQLAPKGLFFYLIDFGVHFHGAIITKMVRFLLFPFGAHCMMKEAKTIKL